MPRFPFFFAFALIAESATCAVYKCVDPDGQVSYQQTACPTEQSQEQVHVADGPTLTPEEQFRAAAHAAGMTPAEFAESLLPADQRAPQTQYAAPQPNRPPSSMPRSSAPSGDTLLRCQKPNGDVYFSRQGCGSSRVYGDPIVVQRNWQQDSVQGMPGAVMTGPDMAMDPQTGRPVQLQHQPTTQIQRPSTRVSDDASVVSRRDACEEAKAQGHAKRENMNLTYDQRSKLDDQVWKACHGTR